MVQISFKTFVDALQPQATSHLKTMAALHYDICQSYKTLFNLKCLILNHN